MTDDCDSPGSDGHGACGLASDRRTFLREGLMAVAALSVVAGPAAPLHALARTYALGESAGDVITYAMPTTDGATIDKTNRLILVRYQGFVHAFGLECPHKGTLVMWEPQNSRFFCPKHKSTFKPEGTRIQGKAPRSLDRYAVKVQDGKVIVDKAVEFDSKRDPAGWAAAGVKVA